MNRFVALQVVFNVVFLANVLYLQRALRNQRRALALNPAQPAPSGEGKPPSVSKAKRGKRRGGFVLTLGLRGASAARSAIERLPEERIERDPLGIDALIDDAQRRDTVPNGRGLAPPTPSAAPTEATRQRAAEDLRRSIRRLQERLDAGGMPAVHRPSTGNA